MKYYVCHHAPLLQRKQYLTGMFNKFKIEDDVTWITGFLPSEITLPDEHRFNNIREYSLNLKHKYAFEDQIKKHIGVITIFEDDVIIPDDYLKYEALFLKEFKELDGDLLFHSECWKDDIKPEYLEQNKHVYYRPEYRTRCAYAYMVTLKAAIQIMKHWNINPLTPDHFLNEIITKEQLRSCYATPSLLQGSTEGYYSSSVK